MKVVAMMELRQTITKCPLMIWKRVSNSTEKKERKKEKALFQKQSMQKLNATINKYWDKDLYVRTYTDKRDKIKAVVHEPSEEDIQKIFKEMYKETQSDILDCGVCGYDNCRTMASTKR